MNHELPCIDINDDPAGEPVYAQPGDIVWDTLTGQNVKLLRIEHDGKSVSPGCWVESDYLGGGRHPWEISPALEQREKGSGT